MFLSSLQPLHTSLFPRLVPLSSPHTLATIPLSFSNNSTASTSPTSTSVDCTRSRPLLWCQLMQEDYSCYQAHIHIGNSLPTKSNMKYTKINYPILFIHTSQATIQLQLFNYRVCSSVDFSLYTQYLSKLIHILILSSTSPHNVLSSFSTLFEFMWFVPNSHFVSYAAPCLMSLMPHTGFLYFLLIQGLYLTYLSFLFFVMAGYSLPSIRSPLPCLLLDRYYRRPLHFPLGALSASWFLSLGLHHHLGCLSRIL